MKAPSRPVYARETEVCEAYRKGRYPVWAESREEGGGKNPDWLLPSCCGALSVLMCPAAQAHRPCAARSLQMLEQAARGGPRQVPAATIPARNSKGDERRPSVRQKEPMACRKMRIVDPDQAGGQREHLAGLGNGKPVLRLRGGFRQVDAILRCRAPGQELRQDPQIQKTPPMSADVNAFQARNIQSSRLNPHPGHHALRAEECVELRVGRATF